MRIAVITDTHVSRCAPAFSANLEAIVAWIGALRPDVVVHLGDASANGAHDPTEYALVRAALANLGCPVRWLPGNHDIGEDRSTAMLASEDRVGPESLGAWRQVFGTDYWTFSDTEWQIVGLNTQLFGDGTEEEAAQWAWLERELSQGGGKLGVMLHKPLFRNDPAETERHPRYVPPLAASQLWSRLKTRDLRFVLAGHTHQLRQIRVEGVEMVWAPSAAYRIPDALQEPVGRKVVGAMVLELTAQAHAFAFVEPMGVRQNDLRDHPNVYPDLNAVLIQREGRSDS